MARTEIELIKDGKVVRADLEDSIINTDKLATDAITTVKIKDGQVTPAKLSDGFGNTFFPIGGIIMWSGATSSIPSGWKLCDGTSPTPDLRGRFVVGASAGGGYAVADTGGSDQVTLTEAQLATHSHGDGTYGTDADSHGHSGSGLGLSTHNHSHGAGTYESSDSTHSHASPGTVGTGSGLSQGPDFTGNHIGRVTGSDSHGHDVAGVSGPDSHGHSVTGNTGNDSHSHDITGASGAAGSSQGHENRPKYYAVAFIMKVS